MNTIKSLFNKKSAAKAKMQVAEFLEMEKSLRSVTSETTVSTQASSVEELSECETEGADPVNFTATIETPCQCCARCRSRRHKLGVTLDVQNYFPYQLVTAVKGGVFAELAAAGGPKVEVGDLITSVSVGGVKTTGTNAIIVVQQCLLEGGPAVTFNIRRCAWEVELVVDREEEKLGMKLARRGDGAAVTQVGEGLVSEFNMTNPAAAIRAGDVVLSMNGNGWEEGLGQEAQEATVLRMVVFRPAP